MDFRNKSILDRLPTGPERSISAQFSTSIILVAPCCREDRTCPEGKGTDSSRSASWANEYCWGSHRSLLVKVEVLCGSAAEVPLLKNNEKIIKILIRHDNYAKFYEPDVYRVLR